MNIITVDIIIELAGIITAFTVIATKGKSILTRVIKEEIKPIKDDVNELGKQLSKTQREEIKSRIMLNIYTTPNKIEVIEQDYDEYKKLGGNSYIDKIIDEWRHKTPHIGNRK
jgi:hypothetical protein